MELKSFVFIVLYQVLISVVFGEIKLAFTDLKAIVQPVKPNTTSSTNGEFQLPSLPKVANLSDTVLEYFKSQFPDLDQKSPIVCSFSSPLIVTSISRPIPPSKFKSIYNDTDHKNLPVLPIDQSENNVLLTNTLSPRALPIIPFEIKLRPMYTPIEYPPDVYKTEATSCPQIYDESAPLIAGSVPDITFISPSKDEALFTSGLPREYLNQPAPIANNLILIPICSNNYPSFSPTVSTNPYSSLFPTVPLYSLPYPLQYAQLSSSEGINPSNTDNSELILCQERDSDRVNSRNDNPLPLFITPTHISIRNLPGMVPQIYPCKTEDKSYELKLNIPTGLLTETYPCNLNDNTFPCNCPYCISRGSIPYDKNMLPSNPFYIESLTYPQVPFDFEPTVHDSDSTSNLINDINYNLYPCNCPYCISRESIPYEKNMLPSNPFYIEPLTYPQDPFDFEPTVHDSDSTSNLINDMNYNLYPCNCPYCISRGSIPYGKKILPSNPFYIESLTYPQVPFNFEPTVHDSDLTYNLLNDININFENLSNVPDILTPMDSFVDTLNYNIENNILDSQSNINTYSTVSEFFDIPEISSRQEICIDNKLPDLSLEQIVSNLFETLTSQFETPTHVNMPSSHCSCEQSFNIATAMNNTIFNIAKNISSHFMSYLKAKSGKAKCDPFAAVKFKSEINPSPVLSSSCPEINPAITKTESCKNANIQNNIPNLMSSDSLVPTSSSSISSTNVTPCDDRFNLLNVISSVISKSSDLPINIMETSSAKPEEVLYLPPLASDDDFVSQKCPCCLPPPTNRINLQISLPGELKTEIKKLKSLKNKPKTFKKFLELIFLAELLNEDDDIDWDAIDSSLNLLSATL